MFGEPPPDPGIINNSGLVAAAGQIVCRIWVGWTAYKMEIKKGIAVSPGIAIAKCLIIDSEDYRIPKRQIEPSQRHIEVQR